MNLKADVKAIETIIKDNGLRCRPNSMSWIFTCPRCGKDKLYIRKKDGRFICFSGSCQSDDFKGQPDWALAEILGRPRYEVRAMVYGDFIPAGTDSLTLDLEDHWDEFGYEEDADDNLLLQDYCWGPDAKDLDHPHARKGLEYLARRGIGVELAQDYGVRYSPKEQRVLFPVEIDGDLKGWQGRYIGETEVWNEREQKVFHIPKMLTMGQIGGKALMFQDRLKGSRHAVLTEGPLDAMHAHLCGGNVAAMGKGVSERQLEIILGYGIRQIYIGLDPDAADKTMQIIRDLQQKEVECYRLEPDAGYDDLGDMPLPAVLEAFRRAPRVNSTSLFVYFA